MDDDEDRAVRAWATALSRGVSAASVLRLIRWWVERFTPEQRRRAFPSSETVGPRI